MEIFKQRGGGQNGGMACPRLTGISCYWQAYLVKGILT